MTHLVTVTHPLTGQVMRLHPAIAAAGVWLPADAAALTSDTLDELRAALDVPHLVRAVTGLAHSDSLPEVSTDR